MNDMAVGLADLYLDLFGRGETSPGTPTDGDGERRTESGHHVAASEPLGCAEFARLMRVAMLDHLRQRDEDTLASRHVRLAAIPHLVEILSVDNDGHPRCEVAAHIFESEFASFSLPLCGPVDKTVLFLLGDAPPGERVRLLTECVRVFGYLVRFGGLPDGVAGDTVRSLGQLVGMLRDAVRSTRLDDSGDADNQSRQAGEPGDDHEPPVDTDSHETSLSLAPEVGSLGAQASVEGSADGSGASHSVRRRPGPVALELDDQDQVLSLLGGLSSTAETAIAGFIGSWDRDMDDRLDEALTLTAMLQAIQARVRGGERS